MFYFSFLLQQNKIFYYDNKKNNFNLTNLPFPSLTYAYNWNTTWGGAPDDHGYGIVVDSLGNALITGDTNSYGAVGYDVIFLKYDSSGNLLWNKRWGGPNQDYGIGIVIDGSGNAFITGVTNSFGAGSEDVFLLKYDSSGNLLWNKTWGGVEGDKGYGIALDTAANVFITGSTDSYGAGNTDIFLLKYNSDGNLLWNKTSGGAHFDNGYGIVLDDLSNVFITGSTRSYGPSDEDVILLKYNSDGNLLWYKTWGGTFHEGGRGIALDGSGNLFITGITDKYEQGVDDVFVLKYDSKGNLLWNETWGGDSDDRGYGIVVDGSENVILTGSTYSYGGGWPDVLLLKYDSEGNLLWDKTWGENNDGGRGIALDDTGNIFITGTINWHEWGDDDVLLLKFVIDTDEDGLSDDDEVNIYRTDPYDTDSDDDLLLDGQEIAGLTGYVTNATNPDTDGDTLLDGEEIYTYFTNPIDPDTDNDGFNDGYEIKHNFDPNNSLSNPFMDVVRIVLIFIIPIIFIFTGLIVYFYIEKNKKKKKKCLEDLARYIKDILQYEINKKHRITVQELVKEFNLNYNIAYKYHKLLNTPIKYSKKEAFDIKQKAKEVIQELKKPTLYDMINKLEYDFATAKKINKYLIDTNILKEEIRIPEIRIDLVHKKEQLEGELQKIKVFISYSTLDSDYFRIAEIAKKLEKYNEIDKVLYWEADSGENIVEYMERTLKECSVFILFCSQNSLNSRAVTDEWQAAFQLRKKDLLKIIPVYEEECHIPALLTPLLNVKFDKDNLDEFTEILFKEILRT